MQHMTPDARADEGVAAREVAGFVGSITTTVCYLLFLAWAFAPESALHAAGVTYYPSKWWALAAPAWLCVAVVYLYTAYGSLNLMTVTPPSALRSVTDPAAVLTPPLAQLAGGVPPVGDLPLSAVCWSLFSDAATKAPGAGER